MKVLIVDSVSDLYGSSRICELLIQFIVNSGHDVSTVVGREHRDIQQRYATCTELPMLVLSELKKNPVKYIISTILLMRSFSLSLKNKYCNYDLVYCNTLAMLPCAVLAKFFRCKVVLHLHETSANRVMTFLLRHFISNLDYIVCVSEVVKDSWALSGDKVFVVHNGINKIEASEPQSKVYDICFVGRLTNKKGIHFFLRSLEAISMKNEHSFKVLIAGGYVPGDDEQIKIPASINGRIFIDYLGEVGDTNKVFSRSKVACIPSLFKDPFPTTVLEGLRAGCTVVATNNGGAAEALNGLSSSYLVCPNDVSQLADSLARATSEFSDKIFRENINFFEQNLSLKKFESEYRKLPFL